MITTRRRWSPQRQSGYSLVFATALSMLLLFSVMAYLKWSSDTKFEGHRKIAEIQAYYTAQAAIMQGPISYLRKTNRSDLVVTAVIAFNDGSIPGMGRFVDNRLTRLQSENAGTNSYFHYDCSAIGIQSYNDAYGNKREVKRRVFARVSLQSFSQYLYFSEIEYSRFDEFIWFFAGDSLFGRVHSNSDIGVHPGAYFGGLVTTTGRILSPVGSTFAGFPPPGYLEHVQRIRCLVRADRLRSAAASSGCWLNSQDGRYVHGIWFHGNVADVYRWATGTPNPPYLNGSPEQSIFYPPNSEYAIFCDGELWIAGSVHGLVGVGAAGNLRLMDNIVYSQGVAPNYRTSVSMTDQLTLISEAREPGQRREDPESGILIANTPANGRDNCSKGRDIAINGQLFALNSSLTFEQQNDTWDDYQGTYPDERGTVYLTGALAQNRRGYLHKSNHGGTGYHISFHYDSRYRVTPPPFQIEPDGPNGNHVYIESWFDDYANREDIGEARYEQRYPSLTTRRR